MTTPLKRVCKGRIIFEKVKRQGLLQTVDFRAPIRGFAYPGKITRLKLRLGRRIFAVLAILLEPFRPKPVFVKN
jgi:hypothetical protein